MSSIRKPKRLIIRGDDEKDHRFLVKGGEDLRLDQRIEQVSQVQSLKVDIPTAESERLFWISYPVVMKLE